ncbi:hypothetical protein ACFY2S_11160, partial [Streptomyces nigra]
MSAKSRLPFGVRHSPKLFEQGGPPLAAPAGLPRTTSTREPVRRAESTHRTPLGPPNGRAARR